MDAAPPAPKKTALHELNVEDDALVRDAALHAVASLQGEHWSFEGEEDVILTVGADAWRLCKPALHAIVKHTAAVVAEDVEAARAMVAVCVGAVGFATLISTRCKEQKKTSSCLNDTLPIQGVQDMDAVAFAGAPKSANAFSLKGITRYPVVKAALCVTHTFESPPRPLLDTLGGITHLSATFIPARGHATGAAKRATRHVLARSNTRCRSTSSAMLSH